MQLIAVNRPQLEAAHGQMIAWLDNRLAALETEQKEEEAAHEVAVRAGWKSQTSRRHLNTMQRQRVFYQKIRSAVQAGYVIMPNFELNVFAIRTDRVKPEGDCVSMDTYQSMEFRQNPRILPEGEGRYVGPLPSKETWRDEEKDAKGGTKVVKYEQPNEFEEVAFPIMLAKPVLMEECDRAMQRKLFDEMGVAADTWRGGGGKPDPIIVGRIRNPRRDGPAISFFIGWFFDPSRL